MPRRTLTDAADFAAGEMAGVRVLPDGVVELANRNLLANPDLGRLTPDGLPVGWGAPASLGPPSGSAWNVYALGPDETGSPRLARTLPASVGSHAQETPASSSGAPMARVGSPGSEGLPAPPAPTVTVVDAETPNPPVGYYGFATAWLSGTPDEPLFSAPSPRTIAQQPAATTGTTTRPLVTPRGAPLGEAGAWGVAILRTDAQTTSNAAETAPLRVYSIEPLSPAALASPGQDDFDAVPILGPFPGSPANAPTGNQTGIGAAGTHDAPDWKIRPHAAFSLAAGLEVRLAWIFRTEGGWSAAQDATDWITPAAADGAAISALPSTRPNGALEWRLIWQGRGALATGRWYQYAAAPADSSDAIDLADDALSEEGFFSPSYVFAADPDSPGTASLLSSLGLSMVEYPYPGTDATALPDPARAPSVVVEDAEPLAAGYHEIHVSLETDEGEGAPSPATTVQLSGTQAYTVERPASLVSTDPNGKVHLGGYCVLVPSPPNAEKPAALAGIPVGQVKYHAPAGTPKGYRVARGIVVPVRAGESYTLSCHVDGTVGAEGASLFGVVFRDEDGAAISSVDWLVELAPGAYTWTRYPKTYTAPDGAAYAEIDVANVGSGTLRFMPPVFEQGVSMTAFSLTEATYGWMIREIDLLPEEESGVLPQELPASFSGASVAQTPPETGPAPTVTYSSKATSGGSWGAWQADAANVPVQRYFGVKIELGTP